MQILTFYRQPWEPCYYYLILILPVLASICLICPGYLTCRLGKLSYPAKAKIVMTLNYRLRCLSTETRYRQNFIQLHTRVTAVVLQTMSRVRDPASLNGLAMENSRDKVEKQDLPSLYFDASFFSEFRY